MNNQDQNDIKPIYCTTAYELSRFYFIPSSWIKYIPFLWALFRGKERCYLVNGFKFLEFCWCFGNFNSVGCKYLPEPHNACLCEVLSKLMYEEKCKSEQLFCIQLCHYRSLKRKVIRASRLFTCASPWPEISSFTSTGLHRSNVRSVKAWICLNLLGCRKQEKMKICYFCYYLTTKRYFSCNPRGNSSTIAATFWKSRPTYVLKKHFLSDVWTELNHSWALPSCLRH